MAQVVIPSSQNRNEEEPLLPDSIDHTALHQSGITGGDSRKVGYYAGLIESIFFVAQALTVLQWSRVSDRVGRKLVLLLGTLGLCLSMLCFGLSHTFLSLVLRSGWRKHLIPPYADTTPMISRCVTGGLNGNVGVMKSMLGELTDVTNRAQGFAFLPVIWSTGGGDRVCGPVIGGSLSRPQDHFPRLFAGSFWGDYPYFLQCLVVAMLTTLTFMTILLFLNETLPGTRLYKALPAVVDGEATLCGGQYGAINKVYSGLPGSHGPDGPVPLKSPFVPKNMEALVLHL
ncbi:hypothetical protein PAXINDRAFT_12739 [Paxillus involutus ATCC 200175]|uniref:Unplaced genomic scaffold PAXINscaffold_21, whole genome shotgun sequence n=1 Tax=Paxillus involutus ATCC 200175 TaxID=664439 RepID=A0A0C9TFH1_PAXIN|nr:hypothetical protein PAXINDRAFT_12739 [Paxillus involutus ATCC 200175]